MVRLVGSTRIRETDSLLFNRPSGIVLGAKGQFFVADRADSRVLEITANGTIRRTFGRKGNGPGELMTPGALALSGDTLLVVMDNGQLRVSLFNLRTGKFVSGFPVLAFLPSLRVVGSELLVTAIHVPTATAVAVYALSGTLIRREGGIPATAKRFLKLTESMPFARTAASGSQVYAAFDMSQSLLTWARNTKSVTEIPLPVTTRRGVKESVFDDLMRHPERARELLYQHSSPAALEVLSSGRLALLTSDGNLMGKGGRFEGTYHVTIVDVAGKRVCPEVPVPVQRNPLPWAVALRGNTLVVLEQGDDGKGEAVTMLRRFTIDDTACTWVTLGAGRQ